MHNLIKYSILMPYYDRHSQLDETLRSFVQYQTRNDFEIVLIEDDKNVMDKLKHDALVKTLSHYSYSITHLRYPFSLINPAPMFNMAAKVAQGQFLILTSPECKHETNILAGLDEEFEKNVRCYVICACQSLTREGGFHMWYQHSIHRNACYHFCSAISKLSYNNVGGFDESYRNGYCFDDDDLRDSIKRIGIPFIVRDDLLVSHQWHNKGYRPSNWRQLWDRNKRIYESKFGQYIER